MQIRNLVLQTSYLETLKEFYSSILELPVQVMNEEKILIKVGATDLIFSETKTGEPFYHFAINIPCNKIEEAKAWLNNKVKLLWIGDYNSDIADFVNWHASRSIFMILPVIFWNSLAGLI
jgi:Predicted ring-cleavage extradiol dioxygenase